MTWFKTVSTLKVGQSFGDLAVQYHQGRSATIVCAEDTNLAYLTKYDYSIIVGKE